MKRVAPDAKHKSVHLGISFPRVFEETKDIQWSEEESKLQHIESAIQPSLGILVIIFLHGRHQEKPRR